MVHLEGEKRLGRPCDEVAAKLDDLQFLLPCVPDVAQVRAVDAQSASLLIRPGFGFVRGELQLQIDRIAVPETATACYQFKTRGVGTSSTVEARFRTEPAAEPGATVLRWSADVTQLGGLLKEVPRGLIQAAARKVIESLLDKLDARLVH